MSQHKFYTVVLQRCPSLLYSPDVREHVCLLQTPAKITSSSYLDFFQWKFNSKFRTKMVTDMAIAITVKIIAIFFFFAYHSALSMRMAAMAQTPPQLCILFVAYFLLFRYMHNAQASPIIQYDREQLLHIRFLVDSTFSPQTMNNVDYPRLGLFVAVPGTRRQQRKWGSRAGVPSRLWKHENWPPLPGILLTGVQLLDNKPDELKSRMAFQWATKNCNVMVFTESWLDPSIPDLAIVPEGVSIHHQDWTIESGKEVSASW